MKRQTQQVVVVSLEIVSVIWFAIIPPVGVCSTSKMVASTLRFTAHAGFAGSAIIRNRVYRIQKRKPIKVRVPRIDFANTILSHQDSCVCIKYQIALDPRNFGKHFGGHMVMAIRFGKNLKSRGGKQGIDEHPCLFGREGV